MDTFRSSFKFFITLITFCFFIGHASDLDIFFDGKHGQIEVGSKYAGAEFHHSRPLPSRISFYYPVANSLDLSTDYWKRYESMPFSLTIAYDNKIDTIGYKASAYRYTPFSVVFKEEFEDYNFQISYDFCENIPVLVYSIVLENKSGEAKEFKIQTETQVVLRTCHTYTLKEASSTTWFNEGQLYISKFNDVETDSALVFINNVAEKSKNTVKEVSSIFPARFIYQKVLESQDRIRIVQLIGSCSATEEEKIISDYSQQWQEDVSKNRNRIEKYALDDSPILMGDRILEQTVEWSKAVLASNIHHLDGQYVPMPCPAEYNFFFTHDALLTDLGAVHFDLDRVKKDLLYLKSLTQADSVLPHAYYWKDARYVTEFCGSDNWNHFWFIILANSYLKHSGDLETIQTIYPVIVKSINLVMKNKLDDDLMYGTQPDWWDIGHIFGARAYISLLMIKALQDFAALSVNMSQAEFVISFLDLAQSMRSKLVEKLWSDETGYLMNMLDSVEVDQHFYAGSLIGSAFDILERDKKMSLIQTAEKELLDINLGIRNAMPADFHELGDVYKFRGTEMGAPYIYANGGIWPQGTIWYCLSLIATDQIEKATEVLKKYLTIEGIKNSPNGQPSFYEYRNADQGSDNYGRIDKPSFTWAGGWFLYTLYRLMGVRENSWNIWFHPILPQTFNVLQYTLIFGGKECLVEYVGAGSYFKSIKMDGELSYSAVMHRPSATMLLERGTPLQPYLAEANCVIDDVSYNSKKRNLTIRIQGIVGQQVELDIVSPYSIHHISGHDGKKVTGYTIKRDGEVHLITLKIYLSVSKTIIKCQFDV